jgi:hypothetical protein
VAAACPKPSCWLEHGKVDVPQEVFIAALKMDQD